MARYEKVGPDKKNNFRIKDTERDCFVKDSSDRVLRKYEVDADKIIEKLEDKPFERPYKQEETDDPA